MSVNIDAVKLARDLVRMDSINPPGGEEALARYLGEMLKAAGLETEFFYLDQGRAGLVGRLPGRGGRAPLVFTGHLDTVPLGEAGWSFEPHAGIIKDGCLMGRGASDMKGGVAAITACALNLAGQPRGQGDVLFVYTAGEETGCDGARQMAESGKLPASIGALVVAEPTSLQPFLGHKGALWLECKFSGKSAHGSMPDMGDNAIYKAARGAAGLENFFADALTHPQLGKPTVNVGTFSGGTKINMVPDRAGFQVDLRTVPGVDHEELLADIREHLGSQATVSRIIDLPGFITPEEDPWIAEVMGILEQAQGTRPGPGYVNYFTDASVLGPVLGDPPILVLGPGDPAMAHQTDECCPVDEISQAADLYFAIAGQWGE